MEQEGLQINLKSELEIRIPLKIASFNQVSTRELKRIQKIQVEIMHSKQESVIS
jgi:hypothetical protein